ncbi:hypothetical protein CKAN_00643200 [Cinnamomum micranthum f. kanehirae]|uniref:Uncharacterized protein n=1 Tax=Cinnamomum micranthum f. kanehirae TaxID=337451 RepID=A0A443NHB1_9MAGN|nr:hypothetical protein CKAN_00643200 [Cinnamomum micranthum f. kanehirae]
MIPTVSHSLTMSFEAKRAL